MAVMLNSAAELTKFYTNNGIVFVPPENGRGWGLINNNLVEDDAQLSRLPPVKLQPRSGTKMG